MARLLQLCSGLSSRFKTYGDASWIHKGTEDCTLITEYNADIKLVNLTDTEPTCRYWWEMMTASELPVEFIKVGCEEPRKLEHTYISDVKLSLFEDRVSCKKGPYLHCDGGCVWCFFFSSPRSKRDASQPRVKQHWGNPPVLLVYVPLCVCVTSMTYGSVLPWF